MKKTRKILAVALFLLLMLTPVVSVSQPVTVQAAAKTTLKKSGGRYYAYENGKKLCNAWRKIKSGKVSYTYYFGANGAAYQADKEMMGKYSVIVKKIKGQYYGFDYLGHRVKGVRVGSTSAYGMPYVYYFNANGTYNKTKTAQLRAASRTNKNELLLGLFSTLLTELTYQYQRFATLGDPENRTGRDIHEIIQYITEHSNQINLSSLAEHFNYAPAYLSRMIKQYCGQSFSDILLNIRLTQAAQNLIETDDSIQAIMYSIGYTNSTWFIRKFRNKYGFTPKDYRKQHQ